MGEEVVAEWKVEEYSRYDDLDSLRITTPKGFIIEFPRVDIHQLLLHLINNTYMISIGENRFSNSEESLWVIDTDPWINEGLDDHGSFVCSTNVLASVLVKYLQYGK